MHLIVDGWCTNEELLRDEDRLRAWMIEATEVLGLHRFGEPRIVDYPFPGREGTALSAVVFLGESSLTIHTYPEFAFIFLDMFHCKDFDAEKALQYIVDSFGLTPTSTVLLRRGIGDGGAPMETGLMAFKDWAYK